MSFADAMNELIERWRDFVVAVAEALTGRDLS